MNNFKSTEAEARAAYRDVDQPRESRQNSVKKEFNKSAAMFNSNTSENRGSATHERRTNLIKKIRA